MLVRFNDFSGGLWIPGEAGSANEQAGFAIPDAGLLAAENIDYLADGTVRGRRGSVKAAAVARSGPITRLARFYGRAWPDETQSGFGFVYSDPTPGGAAWVNPGGAAVLLSDVSVATVDLVGGTTSEYLTRLWPFGANPIPGDATITGLRVRVWFKVAIATGDFSDGALPDGGCRVIQNGAFTGTARRAEWLTLTSRNAFTPGDPYPFSPYLGILEYGGPGDTWGLAGAELTPARFNALDFGVGYRVQQASAANRLVIDYIEITAYFSAAPATSFLVGHDAGVNLTWETLSGGLFSAVAGGVYADPGRRPWVVPWPQKNVLFLFDGVNPVKQYNGFGITDVPTAQTADGGAGIDPKKGPYACLHRNRLWATDPGELQYSVYACDINNETNWRPNLQLAVNDERGGKITGLASFIDKLIIFKDTALFVFSGDPEFGGQLFEYDPNGCVAPDTIQVTPFGVIYLARDGLRITDGDTSSTLSMPIKSLFRSRTGDETFTNAVGVYFSRANQYWLKLDPADAEGYILQRIIFPTEQGEGEKVAWSIIPTLPMNAGVVFAGSEDLGELYLGDLDGFVWQRDTGSSDQGAAYTSLVRTQQRSLDPQERRLGRVYQLRPQFRGAAAIDFALRYDQVLADDVTVAAQGAVTATPEYQEPRAFISDFSKFGRYVSISAQSTAGPQFELRQIDADVRLRGARVWR